METQIFAGIIVSSFGLIIIIFKGFFARLLRTKGGIYGNVEQKYGTQTAQKITFYIGLFGFLAGLLMIIFAFLGFRISGL